MKVFPFTYSVLDTYHETVPTESARMTEESSLDLCYGMVNHKSSAVISECSPHLPVSAYKIFPTLHSWLSVCVLTVCTEMH